MICENQKCNKEHDGSFGSGKFCSTACAHSRNHSIETRLKISKSLGGDGITTRRYNNNFCKYCNKKLTNNQIKYCNGSCLQNYNYKKYIKRWKQGIENGISLPYGTSNYIHKYIRKKYDNKCNICGWNKINKITGNVPVELEHIDGHWDNNKEKNLTLLCPNCHSLTPTYGSLNTGNGRVGRKKS